MTDFRAVLIGMILGAGLVAGIHELTTNKLPPELELKGLQHCMQDNRCYMDPPAYVRYYELKYLLDRDEDKQE